MEAMREHEVVGMDRGKLQSAPFRVMESNFLRTGEIHYLLDAIRPDCADQLRGNGKSRRV